jgi:hypothetical protein
MAFTGREDHTISFEAAGDLTKNYRASMDAGDRKGGYFSKDALLALLNQSGSVGIRYYYGLDADDKQVMVLVGVSANEDDLTGDGDLCMEMSIPCPNQCGSANILNS